MKKQKIVSLLLALLLLLGTAACGGAADPTSDEASYDVGLYAAEEAYDYGYDGEADIEYSMRMMDTKSAAEMPADQPEPTAASAGNGGSGIYTDTNAKLIRTAYLTMETLEFDAAVTALDVLVVQCQGYYSHSEVQNSGDEWSVRYGSYTVRVPKAAYDTFMSQVGNVGQVVHRSESTEDVGEAYYDTELRLKSLNTRHDRLLALMEKADDMDSIVALQNYLADVEYEIDRYSGELRRYDALVDYATINITLDERARLTNEPGEKASFTDQFGAAFAEGLNNFAQGVKNLLIWAAVNFIGLLVTLAIAVFAFVNLRKYWKKRGKPLPWKARALKKKEKAAAVQPEKPQEPTTETQENP